MKTLLAVILLTAGSVTAQTGLIAHKSHSGTAATFAFAAPGNFGAPPASIESIRWINDTTIVQKMDRWGGNRMDTIYNHPIYSDPNISLDSMRQMNWRQVELLDTMNRFRHEAPVKPGKGKKKPVKTSSSTRTKQLVPVPSKEEAPGKKKSALWFFLLGGGTFTGMMLLSNRKRRIVQYK